VRWVTIALAVGVMATAAPAFGQQPAGPDAAPSGSSSPSPDPAPAKTQPRKPAATAPAAPVTRTVTPAATTTQAAPTPSATAPAPRAQRRAVQHKRKPARHTHHTAAPKKHRTAPVAAAPSLPKLSFAALAAPPPTADDPARARKLAAGALSLLILALASATLLAFTLRVERRRVAR
jgi:hypothetical protein